MDKSAESNESHFGIYLFDFAEFDNCGINGLLFFLKLKWSNVKTISLILLKLIVYE